jgi:hypothetical protein
MVQLALAKSGRLSISEVDALRGILEGAFESSTSYLTVVWLPFPLVAPADVGWLDLPGPALDLIVAVAVVGPVDLASS